MYLIYFGVEIQKLIDCETITTIFLLNKIHHEKNYLIPHKILQIPKYLKINYKSRNNFRGQLFLAEKRFAQLLTYTHSSTRPHTRNALYDID